MSHPARLWEVPDALCYAWCKLREVPICPGTPLAERWADALRAVSRALEFLDGEASAEQTVSAKSDFVASINALRLVAREQVLQDVLDNIVGGLRDAGIELQDWLQE